MNDASGEVLRPLVPAEGTSKIGKVRQLWPEIERLKSEGVKDAALMEALAKLGIHFTRRTVFTNVLSRVRKEIAEGKFVPPKSSVPASPGLLTPKAMASEASISAPTAPQVTASEAVNSEPTAKVVARTTKPGRIGKPEKFDWEAIQNEKPEDLW